MTLRYLSICSGIEAASVAWQPLGMRPAAFAEIDAFPSAVLAHRHPHVRNLGDFTRITADDVGAIDVLVGGTPCQSFSIAGLRGGLADDRGNLALEFLRLAQRTRPRWLVWENVPGVLSSNGGRDFGAILGGMVECGYGFAYRILDAQYWGLAQRRKRVFVVGHLGDWRRAAAVLFERDGLQGHSAPSRQARQDVAGTLAAGAHPSGFNGRDAERGNVVAATIAGGARTRGGYSHDGIPLAHALTAARGRACAHDPTLETYVAHTLNAKGGSGRIDGESETFVAHALRAEGFDASEDGTGRGTPLVAVPISEIGKGATSRGAGPNGCGIGRPGDPMFTLQAGAQHAIAFDTTQITSKTNRCQPKAGDPCHPLAAASHPPAVAFRTTGNDGCYELGDQAGCLNTGTDRTGQVIVEAVSLRGREGGATAELGGDVMPSLRTGGGGGDKPHALAGAQVRRLTPRECERLQGFPDDYTAIPYRGKPAADGPRYRALGNSMAVPVMAWIGRAILGQHEAER